MRLTKIFILAAVLVLVVSSVAVAGTRTLHRDTGMDQTCEPAADHTGVVSKAQIRTTTQIRVAPATKARLAVQTQTQQAAVGQEPGSDQTAAHVRRRDCEQLQDARSDQTRTQTQVQSRDCQEGTAAATCDGDRTRAQDQTRLQDQDCDCALPEGEQTRTRTGS